MPKFHIDYVGQKHLIVFSEGAVSTVRKLAANMNLIDRLSRYNELAKRLANSGSITSKDDFVPEDDGFFAIKATPIRAYGWFDIWPNSDGTESSCFVVSHLIEKRQNRQSQIDKRRWGLCYRDYQAFKTEQLLKFKRKP